MKPGTYLQKTYGYTDFQIGQIRYVIMSLLSEFSKLFIMGIFFYSTHMFGEYITAAFILCMIRTGAGGLHFKHYVTCFLFSFINSSKTVIIIAIPALSSPPNNVFPSVTINLCPFLSFNVSNSCGLR